MAIIGRPPGINGQPVLYHSSTILQRPDNNRSPSTANLMHDIRKWYRQFHNDSWSSIAKGLCWAVEVPPRFRGKFKIALEITGLGSNLLGGLFLLSRSMFVHTSTQHGTLYEIVSQGIPKPFLLLLLALSIAATGRWSLVGLWAMGKIVKRLFFTPMGFNLKTLQKAEEQLKILKSLPPLSVPCFNETARAINHFSHLLEHLEGVSAADFLAGKTGYVFRQGYSHEFSQPSGVKEIEEMKKDLRQAIEHFHQFLLDWRNTGHPNLFILREAEALVFEWPLFVYGKKRSE